MIEKYPDATELREVLESSVAPSNARTFYKNRGVVMSSPNKGYISWLGSMFFLSQRDIQELSEYTERESNNQRSSRLYLEGVDSISDVVIALQNLQQGVIDSKANLQVGNVVESGDAATAQVKYDKVRHGRVELLKRQPMETVVAIKPVADKPGLIVVDFIANDEHDYKHVLGVLAAVSQTPSISATPQVREVKLDRLTPNNRIRLFDEFFLANFADWKRTEIKGLKVKKPDPGETTEEEEDVGESDLTGINSAVLQGTSLRTNKVVASFLANKYYFTGATVRLEHKRELLSMDLEINFKGKAEVVELRLSNFKTGVMVAGDETVDEQRALLTQSQQWDYSQYFHSLLFGIYRSLIEEQKQAGLTIGEVDLTPNLGAARAASATAASEDTTQGKHRKQTRTSPGGRRRSTP